MNIVKKTVSREFEYTYETIGNFIIITNSNGNNYIFPNDKIDTTNYETISSCMAENEQFVFLDENRNILDVDESITQMKQGNFNGLCYYMEDFDMFFDVNENPILKKFVINESINEESYSEVNLTIKQIKKILKKINSNPCCENIFGEISFSINVNDCSEELNYIALEFDYIPTKEVWNKLIKKARKEFENINEEHCSTYYFAEFLDYYLPKKIADYFWKSARI